MQPRPPSDPPPAFAAPVDAAEYRRVLESLTGVPATAGNRIDVLRNGVEIFPSMLDAIRSAERTVDLATFVFWTGAITHAFADALAERARAGVRVRVLVDAFGGRRMEDAVITKLRGAGAILERFRPLSSWKVWRTNMRTHRRVLVVDSEVAFTGGVGIAQEWDGDARNQGSWRDTHFRVEGPAVDGIHAAFYSDWIDTPHPVLDRADRFPVRSPAGNSAIQVIRAASEPGWNDAALALAGLLLLANRSIRVTSAYFRPPASFAALLCKAAARGVDVQVLVPGPHTEPVHYRWAAEHSYGRLLDCGVRIWRYLPTMHHAKVVTVDGVVASVGTANFDARSLALNEQIGLLVHDPTVVSILDRHFDQDIGRSEALDRLRWSQRDRSQRAVAAAAHFATFGLRGGGATERDGILR